jgi:hypothetical protein
MAAHIIRVDMESVMLSPHALAWTDEMSVGNGGSAVQAVPDVAAGRAPCFVANRDVLGNALLAECLAALAHRPPAPTGADA